MKRLLSVGIPRNANYVATALEQLGIPAVVVETIQGGIELGIRVFFWNRTDPYLTRPRDAKPRIAVITDHAFLASLLGVSTSAGRESFYFVLQAVNGIQARSFLIRLPVVSLPLECHGRCQDQDDDPMPGTGLVIDEDLSELQIRRSPSRISRLVLA